MAHVCQKFTFGTAGGFCRLLGLHETLLCRTLLSNVFDYSHVSLQDPIGSHQRTCLPLHPVHMVLLCTKPSLIFQLNLYHDTTLPYFFLTTPLFTLLLTHPTFTHD